VLRLAVYAYRDKKVVGVFVRFSCAASLGGGGGGSGPFENRVIIGSQTFLFALLTTQFLIYVAHPHDS
jgi:hypothetical protein